MPVVLHGDAAFSGQGIVPEVMEVCYRLQHNKFDENQECCTTVSIPFPYIIFSCLTSHCLYI